MSQFIRCRSHGYSLLEILVVAVIVAVLAAMLLPAIQSAREAANRAKCMNQLRQMGVAFNCYHEAHRQMPCDADAPAIRITSVTLPDGIHGDIRWQYSADPNVYVESTLLPLARPLASFYVEILPFIEEHNASATTPVGLFLCPSRRDARTAGPRDDYGVASHPDVSARCTNKDFHSTWLPYPSPLPEASPVTQLGLEAYGSRCVLGQAPGAGRQVQVGQQLKFQISPARPGIKLADVRHLDGLGTTLLLAHKGVAPSAYAGGPSDAGWATIGNAAQHKRKPDAIYLDSNNVPNIEFKLSSPHRISMPCLWADGRVSGVAYSIKADQLWPLWSYNDGISVQFDE